MPRNVASIIRYRQVYLHRARQIVLVLIGVAAALALSKLPPTFGLRLGVLAAVLAIFVLILCLGEASWMRNYRFFVWPPGEGDLKSWKSAAGARWASLFELWSWRWKPGAMIVGRPAYEQCPFGLIGRRMWLGHKDDQLHVLTIARSRFGKGRGLIVPNLIFYEGSALVIDPKGELATITATRRGHGSQRVTESLGQDVFVFDPFNEVPGLPKACFNPLAELDPYSPMIVDDVTVLCDAIVPRTEGGQDKFFMDRARALIRALILHVLSFEPPDRHNLNYVRRLISSGDVEAFNEVRQAFDQAGLPCPVENAYEALFDLMTDNPSFNGIVSGFGSQMLAAYPEERSGVLSTAQQQTDFLDSFGIAAALSRSDFKLADLKKKKTTIYLVLPTDHITGSNRAVIIMIFYLFKSMIERVKVPLDKQVLLVFDEFPAFEFIQPLDQAFGLLAGMGIKLWVIAQDIEQIRKFYPNSFNNIVNNCSFREVLGFNNYETAEWVSRTLGTVRIQTPAGVQEEPLMRPDELYTHFSDPSARRGIYMPTGQAAAIIELLDYDRFLPPRLYEDRPEYARGAEARPAAHKTA